MPNPVRMAGIRVKGRCLESLIRFGVISESSAIIVDIVTINVNEIGGKWA